MTTPVNIKVGTRISWIDPYTEAGVITSESCRTGEVSAILQEGQSYKLWIKLKDPSLGHATLHTMIEHQQKIRVHKSGTGEHYIQTSLGECTYTVGGSRPRRSVQGTTLLNRIVDSIYADTDPKFHCLVDDKVVSFPFV